LKGSVQEKFKKKQRTVPSIITTSKRTVATDTLFSKWPDKLRHWWPDVKRQRWPDRIAMGGPFAPFFAGNE